MISIKLVETVGRVLVLEGAVGSELARAGELLKDCTPAATVLAPMAVELDGFLADIEGVLLRLGSSAEVALKDGPPGAEAITLSATLGHLSGRLNEAALAWATLHAVAHRAFESTGEGNLADLAERHSLAYLSAAAAIGEALSEVAIWELEQAGEECQCRCGYCALGVCLCARHGKETVAKARLAAAGRPGEQGIALRRAREGSPAAHAGLEVGDVVVAAGDRAIVGPIDLLQAIRDLPPEADVELTLARDGTVTRKVALRRP